MDIRPQGDGPPVADDDLDRELQSFKEAHPE